jgi:S-adenosylmethionine hydrolase
LQTVDISHRIAQMDMQEAAFVLGSAYVYFPVGSIHFIGVEFYAKPDAPLVIASAQGHYFIGANNGLLPLIAGRFDKVVALPPIASGSFIALQVVPPLVQQLLATKDILLLGNETALNKVLPQNPIIHPHCIIGNVMHIDACGNVITNIEKSLFESERKGRPYVISLGTRQYQIAAISSSYNEATDKSVIALFNSRNLLEIASPGGNANKIYKLNKNSSIMIKFG